MADLMEIAPADAGMHLIGWLPAKVSDAEASRAASEAGWMRRLFRLIRHAIGRGPASSWDMPA